MRYQNGRSFQICGVFFVSGQIHALINLYSVFWHDLVLNWWCLPSFKGPSKQHYHKSPTGFTQHPSFLLSPSYVKTESLISHEMPKPGMKDLPSCSAKWNPLLLWNSMHMCAVNTRAVRMLIMSTFPDGAPGNFSSPPNGAKPGPVFIILLESCSASARGESKPAPYAPPILQLRPFYFPDNSSPWDNWV